MGHRHQRVNTLRPRQNGRRFPDDIFKCIFLNENAWISIKISLKFVPKGPINNIPALVQILAWCRSGDKPLSEPMIVSLWTHICVTRPKWVNPRYAEFILRNKEIYLNFFHNFSALSKIAQVAGIFPKEITCLSCWPWVSWDLAVAVASWWRILSSFCQSSQWRDTSMLRCTCLRAATENSSCSSYLGATVLIPRHAF